MSLDEVMRALELDRWAKENTLRMCGAYNGSLAAESPHGAAKARDWLASSDGRLRASGWTLVAQIANLDEQAPDDWFAKRLAQIEKTIHSSPGDERGSMNAAVIAIGGRSVALRKLATAAERARESMRTRC